MTVSCRRAAVLAALLLCVLAALAFAHGEAAQLSQLPGVLASTRLGPLALMIALSVLFNAVRVLRLKRILGIGGFWSIFHISYAGFLANVLLPLRAGEICMAALLAPQLPGRGAEALSKLLVDRLLDLLAVATLFLVTLFLLIPADHTARGEIGSAAAALAALGGVVAGLFAVLAFEDQLCAAASRLGRLLGRDPKPLEDTLRAGASGLRSLLARGVLPQALGLSLLAWMLAAGAYLACMPALNLSPQPAAALLALCFTVFGLMAMPLPGGLGAAHGAIVVALSLFDIPFPQALAYAIVYHAITTGMTVLLGAWSLRRLGLSIAALRNKTHP